MATRYATKNQYADMRRMCGNADALHVSDKMAIRIMHRLCKKYGMRDTKITFRGHQDSGSSNCGYITLSHNPSIYLIMHEFAHEAQIRSAFFRDKLSRIKNVGTDHHGLHYEIVLNHVNQFCKTSNYFEKMRNRTRKCKASTTPPSPISSVPTEIEIITQKVEMEKGIESILTQ